MTRRLSLIMAFAAFCSAMSLSEGAAPVLRQRTLTGLSKVAVVIEPLRPDVADRVISAAQLKADVQERLRKAGLQPTENVGAPYVCVTVNSVKAGDKQWVFAIDVTFRDLVRLDRDTTCSTLATTWKTGGMLTLENDSLAKLRDSVLAYVEAFALDYTASNTKINPAHSTSMKPQH